MWKRRLLPRATKEKNKKEGEEKMKKIILCSLLLLVVFSMSANAIPFKPAPGESWYGLTDYTVKQWDVKNPGFASCKPYERNVIRYAKNWGTWAFFCYKFQKIVME